MITSTPTDDSPHAGLRELSPLARDAVRHALLDCARDADEIGDAIVRGALARVPLRDDGPHLVAVLRDAVAANLVAFLAIVGGSRDATAHEALTEELQCAAELARSGRTAADLVRLHRAAQVELEVQWGRHLRRNAHDLDVFAEADGVVSRVLFEMADAVVPALLEHHAATQRSTSSALAPVSPAAIRQVLLDPDVDVRSASVRLGYELDRWHVAVAVQVDAAAPDVEDRLAVAIGALERAIDRRALVARPGEGVVHLWFGAPGRPEPSALPQVPDATVAVGRPAHGLAGFRHSRHEAVRALELALQLHTTPGSVTAFEDVEVLSLLCADPAHAQRFADDVLGPLTAGELGTELLETLRVLYAEHQHLGRTAQRLGVHRNTLSYRLRKAQELTGEPSATSLRLQVAVTLAPLAAEGDHLRERRAPAERVHAVGGGRDEGRSTGARPRGEAAGSTL